MAVLPMTYRCYSSEGRKLARPPL